MYVYVGGIQLVGWTDDTTAFVALHDRSQSDVGTLRPKSITHVSP